MVISVCFICIRRNHGWYAWLFSTLHCCWQLLSQGKMWISNFASPF